MAAKKGRAPAQSKAPKPRLMLRWDFKEDGTSDLMPFDQWQEQLLDQLFKFAKATGKRGPLEAELRRIAEARLEAGRALERRRNGARAKASKAAQPAGVAALFAQAYDRLAAKGAKRIGRIALAREARSKLPLGDPRREQCREHDARRWLEEHRSK